MGKEKFYQMLLERGTLQAELVPPYLGADAFYITCFHDLGSCRQIGMSLGPIPITSIFEYADRYDLSDEFIAVIRSMDIHYLNSISEENDKKKGKGKDKGV